MIPPAMRDELQVLELEQALIQHYNPEFNVEMSPANRKIRSGRLDSRKKMRGVYGCAKKILSA